MRDEREPSLRGGQAWSLLSPLELRKTILKECELRNLLVTEFKFLSC